MFCFLYTGDTSRTMCQRGSGQARVCTNPGSSGGVGFEARLGRYIAARTDCKVAKCKLAVGTESVTDQAMYDTSE